VRNIIGKHICFIKSKRAFFCGLIISLSFAINNNSIAQTYTNADTVKVKALIKIMLDSIYYNPKFVLKQIEEPLNIARDIDYKNGVRLCLNISGYANMKLGNIKKAIGNFEESIQIARDMNDPDGEASATSNLGLTYDAVGNYPKALECYFNSLKIHERSNDSIDMAVDYNTIGGTLNKLQYFNEANKCFLYSITLDKRLNKESKIAERYSNIGLNYINQKNYKEAFKYLFTSIRISDSLQDGTVLPEAYLNLGYCYNETGNNDSALFYYLKSLSLAREIEQMNCVVVSLNDIGEIYSGRKNYNEAEKYFKESLEHAKEISSTVDIKYATNNLAELYSKKGDYKNAYEYHVASSIANDSLVNQQKVKALAEMTAKFEMRDMEKENKSLNTENELQKLRLQRKDILIYGSITLGILFIIYALLLIRQNKIRTKQLILELEQKQLRAQMNPHFIFNCLNSIEHFMVHNDVLNANKYLTDFASLIRKTLDISDNRSISLLKETEYLENYLLLEQMRFENKFSYEIKFASDIDMAAIEIPTMIIQPFAENAIGHGLRYIEGNNGRLIIRFYSEGNNIVCEIDDNGIGREKSRELKSKAHLVYKSHGMDLTQKRLDLISKLTNSDFNVTIIDKKDSSGKPNGTLVRIKFPIQS